MKKIILFVVIAMLAISGTRAQNNTTNEYKPFKFNIAFGYAIPGGTGAKGGALFALEPKYAVASNISLGLRIELAATVSGISINNSNVVSGSGSVQASASYLATGDYYFKMETFKPYAGAGIGVFTTRGVEINNSTANNNIVGAASKFGGMIRAGFEYGHFRFGLEYNLVGTTTVPPTTSTSNDGYDIKNSYFGIKLGVLIGGGKK